MGTLRKEKKTPMVAIIYHSEETDGMRVLFNQRVGMTIDLSLGMIIGCNNGLTTGFAMAHMSGYYG